MTLANNKGGNAMTVDTTRRAALQIAAGVTAVSVLGNTAQATPNVVGVWKLVGGSMTDPTGKSVGVPYGPRGMGIVSLTSDGRMMAVLVDGRSTLPDGTKREYSSYCGNYTFDGATLVTTVDANSDPARFTVPQVRKVRFEGERMVLVPPESEVNGVKIHRELTWEKISPVSL
jgi:Lipocalin-like domain